MCTHVEDKATFKSERYRVHGGIVKPPVEEKSRDCTIVTSNPRRHDSLSEESASALTLRKGSLKRDRFYRVAQMSKISSGHIPELSRYLRDIFQDFCCI